MPRATHGLRRIYRAEAESDLRRVVLRGPRMAAG
jgi:hypothetical protein